MTLTDALRSASNSLANQSRQVSTISKNLNGVGNPDYVRRDAQLQAGPLGHQSIEVVRRIDNRLVEALGIAGARHGLQQVQVSAYESLSRLIGVEAGQFTLSAGIGDLQQALDLASSSPSDQAGLGTVVERARELAQSISGAYREILDLKVQADRQVANGVTRINDLLGQIQQINDKVVADTRHGRDVHDALDFRDRLVKQLSEEIGISVRHKADNEIAIYTNSGLTLFDKVPREVSFQPIASYGPGTTGNALYIDNVAATGANSGLGANNGSVIGHLQVRDTVLAEQQARLDELARGLVEAFAETDQTGGGKPPLAGLFTWSGGPAVPASATLETGIALTISVNAAVDPGQGGDVFLLRDGGIYGDPDYVQNTSGAAGFGDRLIGFSGLIDADRPFDAAAGLEVSASIATYADSLTGALEQSRQTATGRLEYRAELKLRLESSLQSQTGPNLDYEMTQLLEVEKAYQASAKLIAAVDELLQTLLDSVR